jgi:hypothetical protein
VVGGASAGIEKDPGSLGYARDDTKIRGRVVSSYFYITLCVIRFCVIPSVYFCVILSGAKNPGSFSVLDTARHASLRRCAPRMILSEAIIPWLRVLVSALQPGFFAAL